MATHPGMLLAYDADGNVVGTLDYMVKYEADGTPIGLVDFAGHEEAGGENTDIWKVEYDVDGVKTQAKGSKVWPEWLGAKAHDYQVELVGPSGQKKIGALVHKESGHRRERDAIHAAIADRIDGSGGGPADIRDLVGGPDRPLMLDAKGATAPKRKPKPNKLPVVKTS